MDVQIIVLVQHPSMEAKLTDMWMGRSLKRVSLYKQRNLFLNIENERHDQKALHHQIRIKGAV